MTLRSSCPTSCVELRKLGVRRNKGCLDYMKLYVHLVIDLIYYTFHSQRRPRGSWEKRVSNIYLLSYS